MAADQVTFQTFLRAPAKPRPLRTMAVIAMTGDQSNDWSTDSLEITPMIRGYQWEVYKKALLARGVPANLIEEYTDTKGRAVVHFKGRACIEFLSMFDYVTNWHAHSPSVSERIKKASRIKTQVGLFFGVEAITQQPAWTPIVEQLRGICKKYILLGTKQNTAGCFSVDPYEPNQPAGMCAPEDNKNPGHAWYVDIAGEGAELARIIPETIAAHRTVSTDGMGHSSIYDQFAFYVYDSVMNFPYYGAATNAPVIDYGSTKYADGWKTILHAHKKLGPAWGNCDTNVQMFTHNDLEHRFAEHYFRGDNLDLRSWDDLKGKVAQLRFDGLHVAAGVEHGHTSVNAVAETAWRWAEYVDWIHRTGASSNFLVNNCRSGGPFYLYWQDGFRVPA